MHNITYSDPFCGYLLNPLTLSDKNLFDSALSNLNERISDNSFANIYLWKDVSHLTWTKIYNHLCVFSNGSNLTLFVPPIPLPEACNEDLQKCLTNCFKIMDNYQILNCLDISMSKVEYVSEEMLRKIINNEGGELTEVNFSATNFPGDYIYDRKDIVNLSGGAFKKKRWAKNKFMRLNPNIKIEVLSDKHVPDCLNLLKIWYNHAESSKQGQVSDGIEYSYLTSNLRYLEVKACEQALVDYKSLNLRGVVVYVGDVLVGFSLGEKLGKSQASILFEKTHPDYDGSSEFIFSEFGRLSWEDCSEINVGDDWFIPTLRAAKESYHPKKRLNKYVLTKPIEKTVLRKANIHDLDRLVEIEQICFDSYNALSSKQIKRLILNKRVISMVACCDGKVIGWAISFVRHHKKNLSGRIYNLAVDPEHADKGIGRKLVKFMICRFELIGVSRVYLEVNRINNRAIHLYHSFNFKENDELKDYYGENTIGVRMYLEIDSVKKEVEILQPH